MTTVLSRAPSLTIDGSERRMAPLILAILSRRFKKTTTRTMLQKFLEGYFNRIFDPQQTAQLRDILDYLQEAQYVYIKDRLLILWVNSPD